ncbi:MAG TPA: DUF3570 domain-containing protein [Candidatus Acidoferrales bacterium]|nr:DUF3570 domain-containing protein [Candidatus Acidoferrales bacterium]
MQVTRRAWGPIALLAGACVAGAPRGAAADTADPATFSTLFRLFTDSENVTVRSAVGDYVWPIRSGVNLDVHWNNERVAIPGISAPPGSQEAVDAITTASRPIAGNPYQEYVKVRNEMQGDLSLPHGSASYYLSREVDYVAHQVGGNVHRDFDDQQLDVSVGSSVGWDDIMPLANGTEQVTGGTKTTLHWNAVATRVLSPSTMLRWGVEYNVVNGMQNNPYREVYAGGAYEPERLPDHRERRDTFLRLNQYLPNRSSLKFNYRLYNDDWGITSHELGSSLSQYVTHGVSATYEYRYYTQTHATFYSNDYVDETGIDGYLTGDYRLNDLSSHLFGASLRLDFQQLAAAHRWLGRSEVWLNAQRYFNSNNYSANILETGLDFHFQ